MNQLNREHSKESTDYPIKVIQFGAGNFLRAYVDWMIDILNEETKFAGGVAVVKPTPRGSYEVLKNQDGLFHTQLYSIEAGELKREERLVSCVQTVVNPYTEFDNYLNLAHEPELRFMVSNTTESGIAFSTEEKFEDKPALSFPAKLTQLLFERYKFFEGNVTKGLILLPLELIENNGKTLEQYVLDYADLWNLDAGFKTWLSSSNYFYNTLVDRIVTGFPKDSAQEIWEALGVRDELLVQGEAYHSWVIEVDDDSVEALKSELPFEQTELNVEFSSSLTPYYDRKVGILNGAHTAMVPMGLLVGYTFVHEAIADDDLGGFIEAMLKDEVLPRLDLPQDNLRSFAEDCLNRFRNPVLQHQLKSIALNSTHKFKTRLLPSLIAYSQTHNAAPKKIVFALACLVRFYKGEWQGQTLPVQDDDTIIAWWQSVWQNENAQTVAEAVLKEESLWGMDLSTLPELQSTLSDYLEQLESKPVLEIVKSL